MLQLAFRVLALLTTLRLDLQRFFDGVDQLLIHRLQGLNLDDAALSFSSHGRGPLLQHLGVLEQQIVGGVRNSPLQLDAFFLIEEGDGNDNLVLPERDGGHDRRLYLFHQGLIAILNQTDLGRHLQRNHRGELEVIHAALETRDRIAEVRRLLGLNGVIRHSRLGGKLFVLGTQFLQLELAGGDEGQIEKPATASRQAASHWALRKPKTNIWQPFDFANGAITFERYHQSCARSRAPSRKVCAIPSGFHSPSSLSRAVEWNHRCSGRRRETLRGRPGGGTAQMTLQIRPATIDDLAAILVLHSEMEFGDPDAVLTPAEAERTFERMRHYPNYTLYVASEKGEIVGTFSLLIMDNLAHRGAPSGIVEDVVVRAGDRGRGIGRQMMWFAMDRCRQAGCYKLTVSSTTRRDRAHRFYESLGFDKHGYSYLVNLSQMGWGSEQDPNGSEAFSMSASGSPLEFG